MIIIEIIQWEVNNKTSEITCTYRPWGTPEPRGPTGYGGRAYHQEARVAFKPAGRVGCVVSS